MSQQTLPNPSAEYLPDENRFKKQLKARQTRAGIGRSFFFSSNIIAFIALIILLVHILNQSMGLVVIRDTLPRSEVSDRPLEELNEAELVDILVTQLANRVRVVIRDKLSVVPQDQFASLPVKEVLEGAIYPEEYADALLADVPLEVQAQILADNLSQAEMYDVVVDQVIRPVVIESWSLIPSIFDRASIEAVAAEKYPDDVLQFRSWISWDFITSSVSSSATTAGLLTALLGTFWIIVITAVVALVIGVGAAIYLEEYATDNWLNSLIEINIRNLAAIPSVIYGMLGLAVFAFAFGPLTAGMLFGVNLPEKSEQNVLRAINSAVPAGTIDEADMESLKQTFFSYRQLSLSNLFTFGTPSDQQARESVDQAIRTSTLTEEQRQALAGALKTYGSFPVNGRTVLSAGLTLALLILPVIITNAQEAIRAVPQAVREASYGLGATRWQTVSRTVLPAALPGIMTGIILSISRAIGETAPLLVVGASTFIGINPNGPFSKFTVVPIQIYQWTSRPELVFKNVAAAAIIILLLVMVLLNGTAIFIRNRFSVRW